MAYRAVVRDEFSYRAKVQWGYNKEKNLLSLRSNVINIKVNTYFSYMLVISISV